MTFHSFTAFLMSRINPWLTEIEGMYDKCMSGWPEGQSDTEFEKHTNLGELLYNYNTRNHGMHGTEWTTRKS